MHKRKIMNYHQNTVDRVIAAQILADRAGLDKIQKENLVKRVKTERNKDIKKENFKRLANVRVNNALRGIRALTNLANTNNYSYTADDYKKILQLLKLNINSLKKSFKSQ